ncbi:NAD-dependent epimerase/dehydratase family protein [Hymenobacter wooponensis]|uniref:NAD-dependent epimerase/dehydratase family protein n=1 Tax=Hymenobacter wooponensis TaxID=1525360 RepID=A0A4Z0ML32_9BACT|nr:NAD-dependent epimerase/dehydratase family protein [Hymenobacter wooponensis]TGD80532.1 NAD-dependent epimerase/dehydratase family protein [Hymenobacter wooponensis]
MNSIENSATTARPTIGLLEWFRTGEYERVEQVLAELQELGVTELRTGVSWADYFTAEGKAWYQWLLPTLARQVQVLPCFLYTPPSLGVRPKTSSPPRNLKAYADFLDVFISDLGEHFEWVELWNEPNNRTEYDFTLDYGWYKFAEMVGGAAYWAKQRGKKTVLGGMSPIDPNWLHVMFERGVMQYIDAVGIHGFPDVFDQLWDGWDANIEAIRQVLREHSSTAELWITEAGFSTWQYDEFKQLQEFKKALRADADRVYWYAARDLDLSHSTVGGFHVDEREYYFGLKRTDGTPKLLYRMWATHGLDGLEDLAYIKRGDETLTSESYTLITGGAGFVGTNLAKRLLEMGKRVLVFDNLSRPGVERNLQFLHDTYGDRLEVYVGDIRDLETVKRVMRNAEAVFHFAAQVAVTTSLDFPINDFTINARGIINVLEAIRAQPTPPALVFTSTNKVYGGLEDLQFVANDTRYSPTNKQVQAHGISEQRALDFHSPYGCSKGTADQYVIDYSRSFGLQTVVFRMSCIYGPHQYGNEDQGWVAHFAIRAIENQPISIYGDGKQVRDVLFVEDLVDAFLLAHKHMPRLAGQAFNIGGGVDNTVSLLELLQMLGQYKGEKIPLSFGDWRTGDQHYYVSDISKFRQATGWYPKHNVQTGVAKLYQWLCESRGLEVPVLLPAAQAEEHARTSSKTVKKVAVA